MKKIFSDIRYQEAQDWNPWENINNHRVSVWKEGEAERVSNGLIELRTQRLKSRTTQTAEIFKVECNRGSNYTKKDLHKSS
jgi:hypothetical protein